MKDSYSSPSDRRYQAELRRLFSFAISGVRLTPPGDLRIHHGVNDTPGVFIHEDSLDSCVGAKKTLRLRNNKLYTRSSWLTRVTMCTMRFLMRTSPGPRRPNRALSYVPSRRTIQ